MSRYRSPKTGAPLVYVLRTKAVPDQVDLDADYESIDDDLIATTKLEGTQYIQDRKTVWNIMMHTLIDGPGWTYAQRYQKSCDARSAYLDVKSFSVGGAYDLNRIDQAKNTIRSTFFTGRGRMTLDKFMEIYNKNFTILEECGQPVLETQKIRDFMHGLSHCPNMMGVIDAYSLTFQTNQAMTFADESNGQPYLLIFHEALFFGDRLSHSLICPNQLRAQGLTVHDTPQQFDPTSTHSIQVHDPPTIIPLHLKGVVSCFPTIKPTDDDLENLPRIIMTSSATWNPCSSSFAKTEEKYRNLSSATQCIRNESRDENSNEPRVMSAARTFISSLGDTMVLDNDDGDDDLYHRLIAKVRVTVDNSEEDPEGTSWTPTGNMFGSYAHWGDKPPPKPLDPNADAERSASALTSNGSKPVLTPETLARRWKISLDKAK